MAQWVVFLALADKGYTVGFLGMGEDGALRVVNTLDESQRFNARFVDTAQLAATKENAIRNNPEVASVLAITLPQD